MLSLFPPFSFRFQSPNPYTLATFKECRGISLFLSAILVWWFTRPCKVGEETHGSLQRNTKFCNTMQYRWGAGRAYAHYHFASISGNNQMHGNVGSGFEEDEQDGEVRQEW